MLEKDPPTGTKVKFIHDIKKARRNDLATLVRPIRKFEVENAGDEYEVEFRGEYFVVQRRDIEKSC
jgi:hypothetical protein